MICIKWEHPESLRECPISICITVHADNANDLFKWLFDDSARGPSRTLQNTRHEIIH